MSFTNDEAWKTLLHGGFSFETASFAVHPCDRERATKMYYNAWVNGVTLKDVLEEARSYLQSKNVTEAAIIEHLRGVENFYKSIKPVVPKSKAWVVFWEFDGELKRTENKIISIRDARVSPQRIAEFVEQYYIASQYDVKQKVKFSSNVKHNPYGIVYPDPRIVWKFYCGGSSKIHARIVKNLVISINNNIQDVHWEEIELSPCG